MKIIYARKGEEIYVDDEDYNNLNQHHWTIDRYGYATRKGKARENKRQTTILMHREIMEFPENKMVDHADRERLNNQKYNLRICTDQENKRNHGVSKNNTSGASGVYWNKVSHRWNASIGVDGKTIFLGGFDTVEKAFEARKKAEEKYFGEFKNNLFNLSVFEESKKKKGCLLRSDNKSGITGVCFIESKNKWTSDININKKHIHLGDFCNFEDAKKSRIEAEIKYFGEFHAENLILDEKLIELSKNKKIKQKFSIDQKIRKNNTSGTIGVVWEKKMEKWKVCISFEGKQIYLGCYETLEEAKQVRTEAEIKYYGRTAEDNNIEQC